MPGCRTIPRPAHCHRQQGRNCTSTLSGAVLWCLFLNWPRCLPKTSQPKRPQGPLGTEPLSLRSLPHGCEAEAVSLSTCTSILAPGFPFSGPRPCQCCAAGFSSRSVALGRKPPSQSPLHGLLIAPLPDCPGVSFGC